MQQRGAGLEMLKHIQSYAQTYETISLTEHINVTSNVEICEIIWNQDLNSITLLGNTTSDDTGGQVHVNERKPGKLKIKFVKNQKELESNWTDTYITTQLTGRR